MQYFEFTIKIPKPSHVRTKVSLSAAFVVVLGFVTWWVLLPGHFVHASLVATDTSPILKATTAALIKSHLVMKRVFDEPEIKNLSILATVSKPVEWSQRHVEVDYKSHSNLVNIRVFCQPKDREQTARLVTQIVEVTMEVIADSQGKLRNTVKPIKDANSGELVGYGMVGGFKRFGSFR